MTAQPLAKGYKAFPLEYMTVLERSEHLKPGQSFTLDYPTKAMAYATRRAFYRFRNALNVCDDEDDYGQRMAIIANRIVCYVEPFLGGVHLKFQLAPLVAAIRQLEAAEQREREQ